MITQEEISQYPNRMRYALLAHIEALKINDQLDARAVLDAAHHQARVEDAYRSCHIDWNDEA